MFSKSDRIEIQSSNVEIIDLDPITHEATAIVDGGTYTLYGEPNLRGGYTYRLI